jgi:hypothetical protein
MKTFAFALVLTLVFPISALAAPVGWKDASSCVIPPDHGVWSADGSTLVGCITDEAWQAAAQAAAARSDANLPIAAAGSIITDEMGIEYQCPYFYILGCYDLTRTSTYRSSMEQAAEQLIAQGYTPQTLPRMAGWMRLVQ